MQVQRSYGPALVGEAHGWLRSKLCEDIRIRKRRHQHRCSAREDATRREAPKAGIPERCINADLLV